MLFSTRFILKKTYFEMEKKGKMKKELTMVEFLYYARFDQTFSIIIPHNNPTDKGVSSSSITEEEIEA